MSVEAMFLLGLGLLIVAFAILGIARATLMGLDGRTHAEPPAPPTLHEVYAADMDHWDQRYQDALIAGLGDECCVCGHNGGRYSCLIHRKPSTHPPLSYIQREAAAYRERRARENHR